MILKEARKNLPFLFSAAISLFLAANVFADEGSAFNGPLVRCSDVNQPTPLEGCGSDVLANGEIVIKDDGSIEISLSGAEQNASYEIVYRSLDGITEFPVGILTVNEEGDGALEVEGFFALNDLGLGNFIVLRDGSSQFLPGFSVFEGESGSEGETNDENSFGAILASCSEITQPATLENCGTDSLAKGIVEIDDNGNVKVELLFAEPNAAYDITLRSVDGTTEITLGTLITDSEGNGKLEIESTFPSGSIGAGNIVLSRNGSDQFVTGFVVAGPVRDGGNDIHHRDGGNDRHHRDGDNDRHHRDGDNDRHHRDGDNDW